MTTVTHVELGTGIHALAWGDHGPPVMLVHGLDGSAANWIPVGQELAAEHRVLAIDLPGFGRTPLGRHRSAMTSHADLVAELARTWASGEPVALAGNSMGGVITALAACRHPGLVSRLTLVASALPREGDGRLDASILPAALSLWLPGAGTAVAGSRNRTPPERRVAELLRMCIAPGADPRDLPDDAVDEMIAVAAARHRRDHVRAWGRSARSLWGWLARRGAFHRAIDEIDAPGTLLTGARDPIIPRSSAQAFLQRHPTWRHVELTDVGHVPPLEAPTATAGVIVPPVEPTP